jgi:hypothetical protein
LQSTVDLDVKTLRTNIQLRRFAQVPSYRPCIQKDNEKDVKENPVLFWTIPTHEEGKTSLLLKEDTSSDGTEESDARANLEARGSTGGRGGASGRGASALETGIVGRGAGGGAARGGRGGSKSGHAHGGVAGDRNAGARSASGSASRCDENRDRGGAAGWMLVVVIMLRSVACNLLGAGDGASRDGHAGAGAGALDAEGTEVVDLVALLDLESVVVAVGQRSRRCPDELAVLCVGGESLDVLEVAGGTLAQDDADGL